RPEAESGERGQLGKRLVAQERNRADARLPRPLVEERVVRVHPGDRVVREEERIATARVEGAQGGDRLVEELAGRLAGTAKLAVHQPAPPAAARSQRSRTAS